MRLNIPPVTRVLVAGLLTLSGLTLVLRLNVYRVILAHHAAEMANTSQDNSSPDTSTAMIRFADINLPYLTWVAPALSVTYPWTLITSSFVETNVLELGITGATLVFGGKYCERVWSSKELAIFVGILATVPMIFTAFLLVVKSVVRVGVDESVVSVVNGGIAFQLGFLVALKQLVPEHSLVLFRGLFTIKVKHLVMPVLLVYSVLGIFFGLQITSLAWFGFFTAWVYLRFLRVSYVDPILPVTSTTDNTGGSPSVSDKTRIKGDASEVFALNTFFYPEPVRELIHAISRYSFRVLVTLKVCTPFDRDQVEQSNIRATMRANGRGSGLTTTQPTPLSDADAERRRAVALKVLEERLQQSNKAGA